MDIQNQRISATQNGDRWTLNVDYTATFTQVELTSGFQFEDGCSFWEWDDTDHDHLANTAMFAFTPGSLQVSRGFIWSNISGDFLDTQLGGEEIVGQIFLRNRSITGVGINKFTPQIQIAPD